MERSSAIHAATNPLSPLRVLLGTTHTAPYDEKAPAGILETMYSALLGQHLKVTSSFQLEPGFIKKWVWDYTRNCYELNLRDDIVFHNGRRATAEDLEFSLLRGFFSEHRAFYHMYMNNIHGIEAARGHRVFQSGIVTGVRVTGPYTVRLKVNTPNPTFLFSLADPYFSLVPKEEMNPDYLTWKTVPVGAGPYRVKQGFAGGVVAIEKVNGNSLGPDSALLYTYDDGADYDVSIINSERLSQEPYEKVYSKLPASIWSIFFSYAHPLGNNVNFRKAIQVAINRRELSEGIDRYTPAYELLPNYFWGSADGAELYNPVKARALLAAIPPDLLKSPIAASVFSGSQITPERIVVLERLKKQLADVGLQFQYTTNNEKFLSQETAAASPLLISGRVTDYADPVVMFAAFREESPFTFERPLNPDPEFEELYLKASNAVDQNERVATVQELSAYVSQTALAVPMLEAKEVFYFNRNKIKSLGDQRLPLSLCLENIELM